jgi:hypothetical protein
MKEISIIFTLVFTFFNLVFSQEIVQLDSIDSGLYKQPNGKYSLYYFDESALGNSIGIIYSKSMSGPIDGNWKIEDRFWQDSDWAMDVVSYCLLKERNNLLVSTSGVYGTGKVYILDLKQRTYKILFEGKVYQEDDYYFGPIIKIINVNESIKQIKLSILYDESIEEQRFTISYN